MINHLVTVGLQIVPKSESMETYKLVDKAIEVIQASGVKYQVKPVETVMEGQYEELMSLCKDAEKAVVEAGATECLVYYRIHYRKDGDVTFEEKNLDR